MSILFSVLMILYLSFCCFYHKKKAQQRIGDSTHSHAGGGDSRDQRRHDNRAVLDESSNAARNAREDEEMGRILEERRERIRLVLCSRLVGERDFGCEDEVMMKQNAAAAGDDVEANGFQDANSCEGSEKEYHADVVPTLTQSTSAETESNHSNGANKEMADETDNSDNINIDPATLHPPSTGITTTSSSSCIDLKRISHTLSNCNAISHHCNNTTSASNTCLDSPHSSIHHNTLGNEECNICLSAFQVGDRIAWSKNNGNINTESNTNDLICRHIFHAECIERWLLVREGCPVCRRNYFDDLDVGGSRGEDGMSRVEEEEEQDQEDLERGDANDSLLRQMRGAVLTRIVAVEE